MPSAFEYVYAPVKGGSVPASRRTWKRYGSSSSRHSWSVFSSFSVMKSKVATVDRVDPGQPGVLLVGREERAYLVLSGAAAEAGKATDEVDVVEVERRQLIVAPLALEGEHLDRPGADVRDRAEAAPGGLVPAEVGAPGGHLARGGDERDRAFGREPAGVELGRRAAGQPCCGRRRDQRSARASAAVTEDDPTLDLGGPPRLDQLLADRPRQGLERLRPAPRTQPRPHPDDGADQRIAPEAGVELAQVVVHPEREAHPLDTLGRGVPRRARCEEAHRPARLPGAHDDLVVADVEQPDQAVAAAQQHAVAAGGREPVGAGRNDVLLDRGGYRSFSRWTSTRNEREAATSTRLPREPPRRSRSVAAERGRRSTRTSTKAAIPSRNPPVAATTVAGSEASGGRSTGRGSASTGSGRTSTSSCGSGSAGGSGIERVYRRAQSVRRYIRYFLQIRPPRASIPRLRPLFVSSTQPASPHLMRLAADTAKCSM